MRATCAPASRERRRRVLRQVRGFRGNRSKLIREAYHSLDRAMAHAFVGRKQKKRVFRALWNQRINAACRAVGFKYSWMIDGLRKAGVEVNRKMLAELAVSDVAAFNLLVEKARAAR